MGAISDTRKEDKISFEHPQITTQNESLRPVTQECVLYQEFSEMASRAKHHYCCRTVPAFSYKHSPYSIRIAPPSQHQVSCWKEMLNHSEFLNYIVSFLTPEDLLQVKNSSKMLRKTALVKILSNHNNWQLTMLVLKPHISGQLCLKESKIENEYEHSQDLDRTNGYFDAQNEQDLMESKLKLDRVVTTVSFQVRYFQGVMPICATLLQCFDQHTSYWVLKYLLYKSKYIQTNVNFYAYFLSYLSTQFEKQLPQVYAHLDNLGFELNYFVMKWVMGLFAQDLPKSMLLAVWDTLLQTDVYYLMFLIIELFRVFEADLLKGDSDEVNELLKWELKQRCQQVDHEGLMRRSKELYIINRLTPCL